MKTPSCTLMFTLLFCLSHTTDIQAQGSAFTYQGRLNRGDAAGGGNYEMSFALYDTATNGNVIGAPTTIAPIVVINGLFAAAERSGPLLERLGLDPQRLQQSTKPRGFPLLAAAK